MVESPDGRSGSASGQEPLGVGVSDSTDSVVEVSLSSDSSSKSNLVTARGTGDGLIIRLDGRVESELISQALRDYISGRKGFLTGNDVVLEWVGKKPVDEAVEEVTTILSDEFSIKVRSSRMKEKKPVEQNKGSDPVPISSAESMRSDKSLSLFDGIEALGGDAEEVPLSAASAGQFAMPDESALWDEADARVIGGTLRSGQKIESDHSLVILGDVNSGAELVAGGDIVVLGKLRGVAHAGAYDETGGGRFIMALDLQPTQLRIGTVISRGAEDGGKVPEVAKVDGNLIVVEPYNSRNATRRGAI